MSKLVQEKVSQAVLLLNELHIDCWLTFVHETPASGDPVIPLIYGHDLTWYSALIITPGGETIAILGNLESETARRTGAYTTIIGYDQSIRQPLLDTLTRLDPKSIAINYSRSDIMADGLSHGLYLELLDYLSHSPYEQRLISAEKIIRAVRGRKTSAEIARIQDAINITGKIFASTFAYAKTGMSEIDISNYMHQQLASYQVAPAWDLDHCPTVNHGPESVIGHVGPTDILLQHGHILHIDFGVSHNEYCSDIQRVAYALAPGETHPPEAVQRGFDTIVLAIQRAVEAMKPGMPGKAIDAVARNTVIQAGYPEYKYATGHQLGRLAHDGAGILGPLWEKYGETPEYLLEAGQVYTVEPGLRVPGFGYIGLEEDVLLTEGGAVFLGQPQTDLILIKL